MYAGSCRSDGFLCNLEELFALGLGQEIVDYGRKVVFECGDGRGCLREVDLVDCRIF